QDRRACRGVLLVPDDPLDQAGAATPVLLRPRDPEPTGGVHRLLPRAAALERLAIGCDPIVGRVVETEVGGEVRREPLAKLRAERVLGRWALEVPRARADASRLAALLSRCSMSLSRLGAFFASPLDIVSRAHPCRLAG